MRRSSGTHAMPRRAMAWAPSPVMSSPRNRTRPGRGRTMPMMALRVVVLPAPFRPMRVTTSPSSRLSETPWRMCASP